MQIYIRFKINIFKASLKINTKNLGRRVHLIDVAYGSRVKKRLETAVLLGELYPAQPPRRFFNVFALLRSHLLPSGCMRVSLKICSFTSREDERAQRGRYRVEKADNSDEVGERRVRLSFSLSLSLSLSFCSRFCFTSRRKTDAPE